MEGCSQTMESPKTGNRQINPQTLHSSLPPSLASWPNLPGSTRKPTAVFQVIRMQGTEPGGSGGARDAHGLTVQVGGQVEGGQSEQHGPPVRMGETRRYQR